ncbi:MAG: phosphate ABC transporter substrate-binding protein PstS [Bacteroidetes bacterium]|nr:phosphate ABC transporter substrate-binding protein PstS [Bacteroidota bacterium]
MKLKWMQILLFVVCTYFSNAQLQLNGAGATFPYVIYSKWFDVYKQKTGIQINYQSIGSGGGIRQIIEGTVDFGGTDGPMTDQQLEDVKQKQGTGVFHIPMVMGAVVVTYNLPEVGPDLKLTPDVLANIFLGKITKWNDSRIVEINPERTMPNKPIVVVHRSDGSGTTYIFVDYLCKVSEEWNTKVGRGTSVNWPLGLGGKGNEGVTGTVKQMDGAIGYVEMAYAVKNNLPYASIRNKEGVFVKPTIESVTKAAQYEAKYMPADYRVSITNSAGKDSYPISGFTWLLVYERYRNKEKGKALVNFLQWALTEGQKYAPELLYAPLPPDLQKMCLKTVKKIQVK